MANTIQAKWNRRFVWGTQKEDGRRVFWFRIDVTEEDVLSSPLETAMNVREDFLDFANQARVAYEVESEKQKCLPSPESDSSPQLPIL